MTWLNRTKGNQRASSWQYGQAGFPAVLWSNDLISSSKKNSEAKLQRFLITGGAGFIGSHLAEHLLQEGHRVHVLDNLSTGSLENIKHLRKRENFTITFADILDEKKTSRAIQSADFVFHLAAAVGVKKIMDSPVETIMTNVRGTENILNMADRHGRPVLITSTSEVYGKAMAVKNDGKRLSEGDDWTLGPTTKRRWAYACSKALDEFLARAFFEEKKLRVFLVRLFNTVGPRQSGRYGMVIPTFVRAALRKEPIPVFGDGCQTRSFTHVADAVRAMILLSRCPEASGEVVNIGSGETISILNLAKKIQKITQSSSPIRLIPYEKQFPEGFEDMQDRTPDTSKLKKLTGFSATLSLDDILRDVLSYFVANQND